MDADHLEELADVDATRQSLSDVLSETMQEQEKAEQQWSSRVAAADQARAEVEARAAKNEALQRAFQASGKTAAEFADMYGLDAAAMRRLQASQAAVNA